MTPKTIGDTSDGATRLARGVLLEILELVPELREKSALAGGLAVRQWVGDPPDFGPLNTADVDVVLDLTVKELQPPLRKRLLESKKYEQRKNEKTGALLPWSFLRVSSRGGAPVRVDLQGPDVGGDRSTDRKTRRQDLGGLNAFVLDGGTLGLNNAIVQRITGETPDGESKTGDVRVVPAFFLVPMKAVAFEYRGIKGKIDEEDRKTKDAADIYALLQYLGASEMAKGLRPYRGRNFVERASHILETRFTSPSGQGADGADALIEFLGAHIADLTVVAEYREQLVELVQKYLTELRRRE